jgi:hypothetical protein
MANLNDVIEQVKSLVAPGAGQEFDYLVELNVPVVLKEVAIKVAESKDESVRAQLQKDFSITLTTGKAPIATMLSAAEPALLKYPLVRVEHTSLSYPLLPVPSLLQLQIKPISQDFGYYTLKSGQVHTKDTSGSLTALTGNLSVTAQYVPTLALLPNPLLPLLVEELVLRLKGLNLETEAKSLLESYPRAVE